MHGRRVGLLLGGLLTMATLALAADRPFYDLLGVAAGATDKVCCRGGRC